MTSPPPTPEGHAAARTLPIPSRIRATAEAISIVAAAMGTLWVASRIPGWVRWEQATLGGQWLTQILAFMVVPLVAVRALGGRPGHFGIIFGNITHPVETALTALAVVGPASGMAFPLLGILGWSPYSWNGGLVLATVYAAALPLTGLVIRKIRPTTADTLRAAHVGIATAVLAIAVTVSALTVDSVPIVSAVLLALFVVGPGEELLFRGVVQTGLDRAFERPWGIFGTDLGWAG